MFKPVRWWSEKNKVKVVFKLQFHASQLTPAVGDALMISVVPADTGKPTVKSDKTSVQDGSCLWENPLYETVKFNRDLKSGKIYEKIYHFVVGTGLSKAGIVGEASLDFSSYAEATKASMVSLPLKNSKTEALLHVSIQRMKETMDQREVEESENANLCSKVHILSSELSNHDMDGTVISNSVEDAPFEMSSSGSEISSGIETPRELKTMNHEIHEEAKSGAPTPTYEENERSWDWLENSGLEASTDDSSSTPKETFLRQNSEDGSQIVIEKLKSEVAALSRQAEMSELELQTLRKQVVKESKKGQDLFKEVVCLKEERDALKEECERNKAFRRRLDATKSKTNLPFEGVDSQAIIEELREELSHANELNANLRIQLQKIQESNDELVLAVRDLDDMLEHKKREVSNPSTDVGPVCQPRDEEDDYDEEQKALEELVKDHSNTKEACLLEQQIMDLCSEIEIYKRDKDELEMQMEQLALDYEIMKQENHELSCKLEQSQIQEQLKMQDECSSSSETTYHELESQIENLENELKKQTQNYFDSLVTISELEVRAKSLEEELEKQAQGFESDLEALMRSKVEQEQRAIKAEEILKKMRWKNANTAEKLQDEFKRLSMQMASSFEANEKLAIKALAEANEFRLQKSCLEDEIVILRDQIEMLVAKNKIMLEDMGEKENLMHEVERMRTSIKEMELLLEQRNDERIELENRVVLLKNEAEETREELNKLRGAVKEKELTIGNLQSELDVVQAQCTELKRSLSDYEAEQEKLMKQVVQLRSDLKKKEDALSSMEKKIKTLDVAKATSKTSKQPPPRGSKEVANLKERIKLLESEIKLKEALLETSANTFLEKEKDLCNKIEELEGRQEIINKSSACFCLNRVEKGDQAPACGLSGNATNDDQDLSTRTECNHLSEAERNSTTNTADVDEFKNQITLLKERNESMEGELKEMQERYSEMSVKFAEVEGERQQLIMKLRNLKNTIYKTS